MPLHLGLILPNYGEGLEAERLAACTLAAEESGFDSVWTTDHVAVPDEHHGGRVTHPHGFGAGGRVAMPSRFTTPSLSTAR